MEAKYFGLHTDLAPAEIARILHGEVVWQRTDGLDWVGLIRFNRTAEARLR